LADYVVTEAGFGADLGAEKFFDIKCRQANLQPDVVVLVATVRALKYHGGAALGELDHESIDYLNNGISNLKRHINNLHEQFGMQVIVAINHFTNDTPAEVTTLKQAIATLGCQAVVCKHWAEGSAGATDLAQQVVASIEAKQSQFKLLYADELPLQSKLEAIATRLYGAAGIKLSKQAEQQLSALNNDYSHLPICVAKTQYSFSSDATLRNAPTDHILEVKSVRLSRGAGFVVALCGDIMTMPGLPTIPASERINVNQAGVISGLS
jgi:formate--tetrahydrofolate ligase